MSMNELRAIATFAKAVELGSLRRAAAHQGVSPQAASQALAQLEQHLGVRLLHRTTRNLALTDEGQEFLESTQPALAALERALHRVRVAKDEVAGPLRIVGPKSAFMPVLWPVIDAFCQQHPGVQPDVQLDDHIGNWVQDRVDVGFRIGAPPEDGLVARQLFPVQMLICASPAYLARHGVPKRLDDLNTHRCSVFRHPATGQLVPWYVKIQDEVVHRTMPLCLSTNDVELELQAVLSGRVIGQLAGISAAQAIRDGRLIPLLIEHMTDHISVHVYYGSRTAQPARVRAFIDLAVERLGGGQDFCLSSKELITAAAQAHKLARKRA